MVLIKKDGFFDDLTSAFAAGDPNVEQKSLEGEHVHCVQLMYHAIARGAFGEMLQLATDDFTLEIVGPEKSRLVGRWQGSAEILSVLQRNYCALRRTNAAHRKRRGPGRHGRRHRPRRWENSRLGQAIPSAVGADIYVCRQPCGEGAADLRRH